MDDNYIVEVNIEGVTEETTIKDIAKFEMRHRNCGGGKIKGDWVANFFELSCNRCHTYRKSHVSEQQKLGLVSLLFKGEELQLRDRRESRRVRTITLIPVGKKD